MEALPEEWLAILYCRSTRDKIAIPIDCDIADPKSIPVIAEMVRDGYMTWLDRSLLPVAAITKGGKIIPAINCDIYLLTPKGTALCDKHGIKQK